MRNLKRALSLAMASIMILGMMVIGAGAVSYDDFSDKDKIVNQEAVNTMVSLGVINGKTDGSYDPTGIVTRAEMAKLIAVMMTGGKDPTLGNITSNFSDTKGNWADSYIAYCANKGIINGRGDGTFGPNEAVTGSAAAKMILTALGYRADIEKLTGAEWEINTNVLANKVKLYDGIETVKPQEGLSRDNTAQMIYNGVQADEVVYRNNYGEYSGVIYAQPVNAGVTTNGVAKSSTVLSIRFNVVKVEGVAVANDIIAMDNGATTVGAKTRFIVSDTDAYGIIHQKPATYPVAVKNEMLGNSIVIYVKYQNELAPNAANSTVIGTPILSTKNIVAETADRMKDADAVKTFLSGKGLSTAEGTTGNTNTAKGVITISGDDTAYNDGSTPVRANAVANEWFTDANTNKMSGWDLTFIDNNGDGTVDYLIRTTPELAKITAYDTTAKTLTIAGVGSVEFASIDNEEDVAKDDIVLYTKLNETYYFEKSETVSGRITAFDKSALKVSLDGKAYGQSVAHVTTNGTDLAPFVSVDGADFVDGDYTLYLDTHGNAIAWTVSETAVANYALVLASGGTASGGGTSVIDKGEVKLLLADGTTAVYSVNLLASANKLGITGSNNVKESTLANDLATNKYDDAIVTFAIGDDKTVTIGDPGAALTVDIVKGAAPEAVMRAQTSLTIGGRKLTVNDSTLFFVSDGSDHNVIKGLSNLPASPIQKGNVNAKAMSAAYSTATTSNNVAKAVFVDGTFKGTSNYVYISNNYTQTQNVNGEAIYTYPAVYEDGKVDSIKVKGNTDESNNAIAKGNIYKYTLSSSGYATLELNTDTINGVVSTYAKGSALTVQPGAGGASNSYTVLSKPSIWNVQDVKSVYSDSLTIGQDLAIALDGEGYVKVVFVKDNNLEHRAVQNMTGATLTINGASITAGSSHAVANGYDVVITNLTDGTSVTYNIKNDTGKHEDGKIVNVKNKAVTITMPANATLQIVSASTTPVPPADTFYKIAFATADYATYTFTVDGVAKTPDVDATDAAKSSITVKKGAVVTITGAGFTKEGTVDLGEGITGTVAGTTLTFTAAPAARAATTDTINLPLPSPAAITAKVTPKPDTNTYKISFSAAEYPTADTEFWVSGKEITPTEEGATARFINVKATDKVEILDVTNTPFTAGSYQVTDGVIGTATTSLLTFTGVSKSFTLKAPAAVTTDKLFAVHIGDAGVTVSDFKTSGTTAREPIIAGGVYYVAAADTFKVTTAVADKAIAVVDDATKHHATGGANADKGIPSTKAGATYTVPAVANAKDVWLYSAATVTVSTGITAKYGATTITGGDFVALDTTLTLTVAAANGTSVLAKTATSKDFGAGLTSYTVTNEDVTLNPASKLALGEGVTATLSGDTIPSGDYLKVTAAPTITVDATKGTGVYNQTNAELRTSDDGVASGATFAITKADANLQPGVAVSLTNVVGTYTTSTNFDVVSTQYVAANTKLALVSDAASDKLITVKIGSDTSNIGGDNYNVAGDGSTTMSKASYTLGVVDVEFALSTT